MSSTYSINIGQLTEATSKQNINLALSGIPDNIQKLINPKNIRDAILTNWANSVFKIIQQGNFRYIGLDTGDPSNNDIKSKILIGKRRYNGIEVLNQFLLSSDTDIFFYNTKEDNQNQDSTKVKILAGNNLMSLNNSPFLEAKRLVDNKVEFNIEAVSNINIKSESDTVKINNISFPTISENLNLQDGKVLKYEGDYPNGKLVWSDLVINSNIIGSSNSIIDINGSFLLNDYPLEFIEDRLVPNNIGGVNQGDSFSENSFIMGTISQNWPIIEVIRKLLYPYIEPKLELSVINEQTNTKLAEIGKTASISISYSITSYARDENEYIKDFFISDGNNVVVTGSSFSSNPGEKINATQSYLKNSTVNTNYTLHVSNNWDSLLSLTYSNTFGFSYSISDQIEYISPFFAYFNNNDIISLSGLQAKDLLKDMILNSNREVVKYNNEIPIEIGATGSGYLYLAYPNLYGYAKTIKDPNGFIIHNDENLDITPFTYSTQQNITPSTPYEYYGNYLIYKTKLPCSYDGLGKFKIEF